MDEPTIVQYARRYLAGDEMLTIARDAGYKTSAPISSAFKKLREKYGDNSSGKQVKHFSRPGVEHLLANTNAAYLYSLRLAVVRWNHINSKSEMEMAA